MFVIQVIPLIKATKINTLTYFSSVNYEIGTILSAPIRGKSHQAIVISSKDASDYKTTLRNASFTLRKLPEQQNTTTVPASLRQTAEKLTESYPSSLGAIMYQLLSPDIRNGNYQYPTVSALTHQEETIPQILTATTTERYVAYRSYIRSTLARRGSVMFVVPNSADLEYAKANLSHGIEDRIVIFSPYQSKSERKKAYAAFEDTSIAKVIITTTSHAYLDRVDLLTIIMENSASNLYKDRTRPYLDHRTALTTLSKITGRSVLLGDILPRSEDEHYRRQDLFITYNEETKRIPFSSPITIIEQKDKPSPDLPFMLFSPELKRRAISALEGRGRVFMYGARRGIAPVVACVDCGFIFRCPDSNTPYSLIRTYNKAGEEDRWFVSSTSGRRVRASDTCTNCGSWRLKQRGIGIQHVFDECVANFPNNKVLLFDNQTASTKRRASKIIDEFYSDRGTILVGTQMALAYLSQKGIDLSAVVSLDAARSNPTWRADEEIFRLLLQLRDLSHKEVLVQTRTEPDDLMHYIKTGSLESFYNDELALREALNYPPFSTFILMSWTGNKDFIATTENTIKSLTKPHEAFFYTNPNFGKDKFLRHALFRLPAKSQALKDLIKVSSELPPYVRIEIDPNRIV